MFTVGGKRPEKNVNDTKLCFVFCNTAAGESFKTTLPRDISGLTSGAARVQNIADTRCEPAFIETAGKRVAASWLLALENPRLITPAVGVYSKSGKKPDETRRGHYKMHWHH